MPEEWVAEMHADYRRTGSLRKTARLHGRSNQALYDIFKARGLETDLGPVAQPKWPKLQPQPATKLRGKVVGFTFDQVRAARSGKRCPSEVRKCFANAKAMNPRFGLKPRRRSLGVIWNRRAFYWTAKGFYRPGNHKDIAGGRRRPLHHLIWESANRKELPPMWEVVFRNRDRHDFRPSNLKAMHKRDVHRMYQDLGVCNNGWIKSAKERLGTMLERFERKETNGNYEHSDAIKFLGERRKEHHPQATGGR